MYGSPFGSAVQKRSNKQQTEEQKQKKTSPSPTPAVAEAKKTRRRLRTCKIRHRLPTSRSPLQQLFLELLQLEVYLVVSRLRILQLGLQSVNLFLKSLRQTVYMYILVGKNEHHQRASLKCTRAIKCACRWVSSSRACTRRYMAWTKRT